MVVLVLSVGDQDAGVFIDDGADLDRSALLVGVELEIDCPDHVRLGRCRRACQMVCVRGGSPYGRKHTVGYRQGVA